MTASLVGGRSPTCLACLRRLAQPFGSSINGSAGSVSLVQVQVRAKSNRMQPRDQGVVVRLLEDIPYYGRKDSVFRVERGRMRNVWYPRKMAEYMTPTRFRELGLTKDDIGERDTLFGSAAANESEQDSEQTATKAAIPKSKPKPIAATPEQTHTILNLLVPETLTFYRKPIPAPTPARSAASTSEPRRRVSPLVASAQSPEASTRADAADKTPGAASQAIFGSVSTADIVGHIKGLLVADADASRISLDAEQIRFVGLGADTDRVKALGTWEIEIAVGGNLEPVRKMVDVIPLEETSSNTGAEPAP